MSSAELEAFRPRSQDECEALSKEMEIVDLCKENGENPDDEDVRDPYREATEEMETWWEDLSDEDREGWEHNMTKDPDQRRNLHLRRNANKNRLAANPYPR
jgi:hypothetical protein